MKAAATPAPELFDVELPPAPYPGLRPFEQDEWPVFFGREVMTGEAIRRLLRQNLLVVHGDSGCGKSSLIRAGVLVQLEQRHARGAQRWRTRTMLPREAPLRRLAEALAGLNEGEQSSDLVRQVRRALNAGRGAAAKLEDLLCTDPRDRVCILMDQFEELFRFAKESSADEATLFVDVLVGLLEEAERRRESKTDRLRLYAILTMRSEFLGACARFEGLAEAVNESQYLLPRMERADLLRAIREPAALYGGEVSRELAERLIAEAGGGQDQLPLIQHGLLLLWRSKIGPPIQVQGLSEAAAPFHHHAGPAWQLGLEDYQSAGGLGSLLSKHADDVMEEACRVSGAEKPDPERRQAVEHLFRALIDINAEGQAVRRPQTLAELVAVTGSDEQVLRDIIDRFRAGGVSFLRPYGGARIEPGNEIDISHEALIRCWEKIADREQGWLQHEFQDGLVWRSLIIQAQSYQRDPDSVLSPARTEELSPWLEARPSPAWSKRYGGWGNEVRQLMEASRQARDQEDERRREFEEAKRGEAAERARQAEEARAAIEIASKERQLAEAERQKAIQAEAGRRRASRLARVATLLGLLAFTAAASAGGSWWHANKARELAQESEAQAKSAEAEAHEARKDAQLAGSLFRSVQAREELGRGLPVTAMQLALAGLPETTDAASDRRWVGDTAGALVEAMAEQREIEVLRGHEGVVWAAEFSPAGDRIVSGSDDRTVRVWDAASGGELLVLRGHDGQVYAAEFSPAGDRIVSGSDDGTVRLWDAASGEELLVLRGHEGRVFAAAFSPAGDRIVSGSHDDTVRLWDAASGEELLVLRGHERWVFAAGFSPAGDRIVSAGNDGTVRLWDAASGEELLVLRGHEGVVWAAAFSPAGNRIVSGAEDGTVRVWDAASGEELLVLRGHEGVVYAAEFSPAGDRIVSGGADGTMRLWDAASGEELKVLRGHEGVVYAAGFSPAGDRIVSAGNDGTVRVWDAANSEELLVLRGPSADRCYFGECPDGTSAGAPPAPVDIARFAPGGGAAFSPAGDRIVSGSDDGTVRVWDAATGEELLVLRGHEDWVYAAAFSPAGDRIVSGSDDGRVRVWDAATGEELLVLLGHEGWVYAAAFSPAGDRIVSGSDDRTVRVWDAASGEELLVLRGHEDWVRAVGFSPAGDRIVSGSDDDTVRVWDAASGEELLVLRGHERWVYAAEFSPAGDRIVSGSNDDTLRVWDAASGEELLVLRGHEGVVYAAGFSPAGDRIVSGAEDGTVRVWDAASGEELLVLRGHESVVYAAEFSPAGDRIVSASSDGTVRVTWVPASKQELIDTALARLPRELTPEERRRFYLAVE